MYQNLIAISVFLEVTSRSSTQHRIILIIFIDLFLNDTEFFSKWVLYDALSGQFFRYRLL